MEQKAFPGEGKKISFQRVQKTFKFQRELDAGKQEYPKVDKAVS